MSVQNVCVYCGSSNRVDPAYKESARAIATLLAQKGLTVVYGGGHVGLMGITADAALEAGGKVIGIIPEYLHGREVQHQGLTELIVVPDMHKRKAMMADKADAFLVLPGGFGTLDEVFEILTWKQLGMHNKPVIFFNQDGFWDPAIALIESIIERGFAPADNRTIFNVTDTPDQIIEALNAPLAPKVDPTNKWA